MKKLLLSLLACSSIAIAQAQKPNSTLLYTDLGYTSAKDSAKNDMRNWNADIGIGYQFNENWTVGLNLGWDQFSTKQNGSDNRNTVNDYRVGPFLRYSHYIAGSNTFFWYGQFNASYRGGYTTYGDVPSFDKHTGFNVNITPALGINLGKAWCLNFSVGSIGYTNDKADGASESYHSFDFTLGQTFAVGVSKNFGGAHHMHGHHEPMDDTRHINTSDDDDMDGGKKKKTKKDDDE